MLWVQAQHQYSKKLQVLGTIPQIIKPLMKRIIRWMNAASMKGKANHNHAAEANVKRKMVSVLMKQPVKKKVVALTQVNVRIWPAVRNPINNR